MLDNHLYNLMNQIVTENKTLYRINEMYMDDAGDCDDCKAFWKKMKKDKEDHIKELEGLIKDHFC